MIWLIDLFKPVSPSYSTVAQALMVLALVAASGLALGSIKLRGLNFGVAGVLFAGLAAAHFGLSIEPEILEFVREFGLILFVYTIGLQVGPGLMNSLKREGLKLNALALCIVLIGTIVAVGIHYWHEVPTPAAVGLLAGGATNTPSLAAAQQALRDQTQDPEIRSLPGLAYAIAYPFGVIGLIVSMLLLRSVFRINVANEREVFLRGEEERKHHVDAVNLEVQNPNLEGLAIKDIPYPSEHGVVVSRIMHDGVVKLAMADMKVHVGDVLTAIGPEEELAKLKLIVGKKSALNLMNLQSKDLIFRWLLVTKASACGKNVQSLRLRERFGVTVARIARAGVELPVSPQVKLQFGDRLSTVGSEEGLAKAAHEVGNAPKELNHPMLVPIFVGILLGVLIGSYPIMLPGLPAPVKLGLAGGPLLVAIVLSRIGKIGPLVWYMPGSANLMLREIGIALFLACVGLKSGSKFIPTLLDGDGFKWMALAALITLVPPLSIGFVARKFFNLNYLAICGLLAGSMTDPPALAYVSSSTESEAPSIAYATVYPLTMFLRVLIAQIIILFF